MNRSSLPTDDSWENDAVWMLLDQATPQSPSARFVDDTVREARLEGSPSPWWRQLFGPLQMGIAGTVTAAAAVAIGIFVVSKSPTAPAPVPVAKQVVINPASANIAAIEDIAETEVLISAVDRMDDYSDHELVTLIGF
ncbi:hypothetical protein JIN85_03045 [Luteolibacter pohnpeiensis]|uniref:Uncharacterized protein n=1 Tax=Luteolibacter pohnpeiensis TaxID=454153 RepID=A0A934VUQ2_9BACT|nr:hypothetical protein [Luteolibacter pohnpeiensis]MBK1881375.1 hypothetical protein [Luteolibacter pohnpeiensis]